MLHFKREINLTLLFGCTGSNRTNAVAMEIVNTVALFWVHIKRDVIIKLDT